MSNTEVLLLNPAPRRGKRRKNPRAPSPAQLAQRKRFAAAARARSRRRNPTSSVPARLENPLRRRRRRRNPLPSTVTRTYRATARRRRNPLDTDAIVSQIKAGFVQGAGAVGFDIAWGYILPMLPANMRPQAGVLGAGDAIKAVTAAALGELLANATNGASRKAAVGALTIQARDIVARFMPARPSNPPAVAGFPLGYVSPGQIVRGNPRVGLTRGLPSGGVGALTNTRAPVLGAFSPGAPVLSGFNERAAYAR